MPLPFIAQTDTCPVVLLRQAKSETPSPLKSPTPMACQSLVADPGWMNDETVPPPFIAQIESCPRDLN